MAAGGYWDAVQAPLAQLIARNGLGADKQAITVQTLGGGSRVPAARAALQAAHPAVQLEKQLDASEAFAMGAGLHAANLSTTFKLRRFGVVDASPFAVSVGLDVGVGELPTELQVCCCCCCCCCRQQAAGHAHSFCRAISAQTAKCFG